MIFETSLFKHAFDYILAFFGVSSFFVTIKMFILDQIPNLTETPIQSGSTIAIATYLSFMLGILYKQNESMKNIEKAIKESLDFLKGNVDKENEKHKNLMKQNEVMAEHLKNINDKEKEQLDIIRESSNIKSRCDLDDDLASIDYRARKRKSP